MSDTPETATKEITLRKALEHIQNSKGKFFAIRFIKRSDGSVRDMVCQTNVQAYLKGGEPAYDFAEHGLVSVFDVAKKGYRAIGREGITHLKLDGVWCIVKQSAGKLPEIPPRAEKKPARTVPDYDAGDM